ncbi:MAG: hypothetical protein QNK22_08315 [Xanthomonadales bacterium]|nr:hypothetical protein [Xanthomonadales bacterium]
MRSIGKLILLPALEVRVIAGLVWTPAVLAVTSTVTVQDCDPPIVASLKVMVLPPSGADNDPVRLRGQSVEALEGSAIVTAAGKVSVNARLVTGEAEPFVMVKVAVLTLPEPMVAGKNTFDIVGCPKTFEAKNIEKNATSMCFKPLTP